MPLEGLQEKLRHGGVAIIRVEDIYVLGTQANALVHPAGCPVRPVLYLVKSRLGAARVEVVLGVVEDVNGRLLHVPSALGGGEQIGRTGVNRPVAIPKPEGLEDITGTHIVLPRKLGYLVGGIEPPGCHQPVAVLVNHKGGQVVVGSPVFAAILFVGEDVDEIVAAVVPPGNGPLAASFGVVLGVFSSRRYRPSRFPVG